MLDGRGIDESFAEVTSGATIDLLRDSVNSTIALSGSGGTTTSNYQYSPFGTTTSTGSGATPFEFTGRENDGATGLYYYRGRYYSPLETRFISQDPIGQAGGVNTYAYAAGNPISFTDPFGLDPFEIIFWNPVGSGRSSLGHVSERIGDTSYSFGEKGNDVRPFDEYLALQDFRGGYGLVIDIPADALSRIADLLKQDQGAYIPTSNNCTKLFGTKALCRKLPSY